MGSKRTRKGGGKVQKENSEWSLLRQKIPRLEELIRLVPDVREEKVRQIRERLRKGIYRVRAERIAEKMIEDSLLDDIDQFGSGKGRTDGTQARRSRSLEEDSTD